MTGAYDSSGSAGDGASLSSGFALGNTTLVPPLVVAMPMADPDNGIPAVTAIKLAKSRYGMACVGSDGQCYAWGSNQNGFIGLGTAVDSNPHAAPVPIAGLPTPDPTNGIKGITGIYRGDTTEFFYNGLITNLSFSNRNGNQVMG